MTQRDKWAGRPIVKKYYAFKNECQLHLPKDFEFPASGARVTFFIEVPKSWSKKKKKKMESQPHQKRPDLDNYIKGLLDALCKEDNYIWNITAEKRYTQQGKGCVVIEYE